MTKLLKTVAVDGNEAAAYAAYAFTEIAAIYPITPSSPMAELTDEWAAKGKKNVFGQAVDLVEMQSEAGAVGAIHGALEAGSLATSFTSSQGLMLMIPVLYRIAGTRQPGVLHVASRTVGTHAMSIFGDHSDVMACRATGFAQLSSGSVQEAADLGFVAHLAAIKGTIPTMHFFDGFRTSHEIQKINLLNYEDVAKLLDKKAVKAFRDNALNPEHPTLRNTVQNPDIYFQVREANNESYDSFPEIVSGYMAEINKLKGSNYKLFNYYGAKDAEQIIIAMGSVSGTIMDTVDYLNAHGEKVGFLQVHLYRPFSVKHFLGAIPKTVKRIAVLDRVKEHGSVGEPLFEDVCSAYYKSAVDGDRPVIIGGRYGLSSKDTDPDQIVSVYDNLKKSRPKTGFTIGIEDDVTKLSLPIKKHVNAENPSTIACKFWGLGSDGTVGANKNSIKIISEYTDLYTQAYFEYDTKKSFGVTKSHLRFGKEPIRATHLIKQADFIACHNPSYIDKYDIVNELKQGGTFLLNCSWDEDELAQKLPAHVKKHLSANKINFYTVDANKIARELGLGNRTNTVLQAVFFSLSGIIPVADAEEYMKDAAKKTYGKKGKKIVASNIAAIEAGLNAAKKIKVPSAWKNAKDAPTPEVNEDLAETKKPEFITNILEPLNAQKGDSLPVSTLAPYRDGTMPMGTSAYEKRGIAIQLPVWHKESCLQCNMCSFVCPHSVVRPFLLDKKEVKRVPEGFELTPAKGAAAKDYEYSLQISKYDCTGCGSCEAVCPAKNKAITMKHAEEEDFDRVNWDFALTIKDKGPLFDLATVKGSQFKQPLLEFSGACAGCGETPYAKLLTQLFGDRMYWANATGCTQAWGASMPTIPYTVNSEGRGPAWSNSLFEDNAEFSLGMQLAAHHSRNMLKEKLTHLQELVRGDGQRKLAGAIQDWLNAFDDTLASEDVSIVLIKLLNEAIEKSKISHAAETLAKRILARSDFLAKKTIWMYGGDGWAYDIGYGGLDHVFSMGVDINALIVDTEVYSNTGSQSSKATPLGAAVKFQASGKKTKKKDLGLQMMSYGNIYVAQVAMGANPAQLMKAIIEAETYPGPSLVIAYAPCTAHGIKLGMDSTMEEMKRAVDAGYWNLYRFDPRKEKPFTLDSKEPKLDFHEFLSGEIRYSSLEKTFPENAKRLFAQAEKDAKAKYEYYKKLEEDDR
ncbi:MAG: pyruvate:ferredoxin (flavodoxin) oxidoreductase [Clostridiales Family XIII bacterium]|jgi:pyruvate-ferredoxin/flavodoxin oxidoreductase|nr:pyruvate:ferredoxin (flavodoxin) oxidoreductase [Clostridiales Family XIII bacterium]